MCPINQKPKTLGGHIGLFKAFNDGRNNSIRPGTIARREEGDVFVSTVRLPFEHSYGMWYETMVFGGSFDGEQHRYRTKEEALVGHEEVCKMVFPVKIERCQFCSSLVVKDRLTCPQCGGAY